MDKTYCGIYLFRAAEHKLIVVTEVQQSGQTCANMEADHTMTLVPCPGTLIDHLMDPRLKPYRQAYTLCPDIENGWKNLGWQDHKANMSSGFAAYLELHHSLRVEVLLRGK